MARALLLLPLFLLLPLTACKSQECYSSKDCADGSTCCDGACTGVQPIPIGPATCTSGCECESFLEGDLERSQCFYFEGTRTTQCTRTCELDEDCVTAEGLAGRCLERDDAALASRLCVWEAP